jgi:hypothetical protein
LQPATTRAAWSPANTKSSRASHEDRRIANAIDEPISN